MFVLVCWNKYVMFAGTKRNNFILYPISSNTQWPNGKPSVAQVPPRPFNVGAHWLNGLADVREVSTLITLSLTETNFSECPSLTSCFYIHLWWCFSSLTPLLKPFFFLLMRKVLSISEMGSYANELCIKGEIFLQAQNQHYQSNQKWNNK